VEVVVMAEGKMIITTTRRAISQNRNAETLAGSVL
jgi:hypothetical protein